MLFGVYMLDKMTELKTLKELEDICYKNIMDNHSYSLTWGDMQKNIKTRSNQRNKTISKEYYSKFIWARPRRKVYGSTL